MWWGGFEEVFKCRVEAIGTEKRATRQKWKQDGKETVESFCFLKTQRRVRSGTTGQLLIFSTAPPGKKTTPCDLLLVE